MSWTTLNPVRSSKICTAHSSSVPYPCQLSTRSSPAACTTPAAMASAPAARTGTHRESFVDGCMVPPSCMRDMRVAVMRFASSCIGTAGERQPGTARRPGPFIHLRRMTKALFTLRRKVLQRGAGCRKSWIPAFAGMTSLPQPRPCRWHHSRGSGNDTTGVCAVIPAKAGIHRCSRITRMDTPHAPSASVPSFPRRRESIGVRASCAWTHRTRQAPAFSPSFPRRRESIGVRASRAWTHRTRQAPAFSPSFPRRRESIGVRRSRVTGRRTRHPPASLPSFPRPSAPAKAGGESTFGQ